ncbi:hypothetical protein VTN77DRAFT_1864 [Rasamsonia byssochlamydoides]|uniref:uncharacterized protein n=1 Tax=Rasamsonia byssochlamydoides TaxID=89139 RepID=UPI00374443A7
MCARKNGSIVLTSSLLLNYTYTVLRTSTLHPTQPPAISVLSAAAVAFEQSSRRSLPSPCQPVLQQTIV